MSGFSLTALRTFVQVSPSPASPAVLRPLTDSENFVKLVDGYGGDRNTSRAIDTMVGDLVEGVGRHAKASNLGWLELLLEHHSAPARSLGERALMFCAREAVRAPVNTSPHGIAVLSALVGSQSDRVKGRVLPTLMGQIRKVPATAHEAVEWLGKLTAHPHEDVQRAAEHTLTTNFIPQLLHNTRQGSSAEALLLKELAENTSASVSAAATSVLIEEVIPNLTKLVDEGAESKKPALEQLLMSSNSVVSGRASEALLAVDAYVMV